MNWVIRCTIASLAFLLTLSIDLAKPQSFSRIDEGIRDSFIRLFTDETTEDRVVIVDLDERSLAQVGPWPWPRGKTADLVEILLGTYGARGVGLDIVFPEPGEKLGDARLASLAAHAPLTLAQIIDYAPNNSNIRIGTLVGGVKTSTSTEEYKLNGHGFIANHAAFQAAKCVGNIGYQPDVDGVLRRIPITTHLEQNGYVGFSMAMLKCGGNGYKGPPTDEQGMWRIPFSKSLSAYLVISAADVLSGLVPASMVTGRFVLVGSSALGLGDRVATPLAPLVSGVLVHAASLTSLLDISEGLKREPWSGQFFLLAWSAFTFAIATLLMSQFSAWGSALVVLALSIFWILIAGFGFYHQVEWAVSAPLFGYFFLLLVGIPHEWWQAQKHGRRLLATFSHYVAPSVLDEIVRLDLQHSLVPKICEVTVLIADMEGYTRHTNSLSLDAAAALTKDFLACLTSPVLNRQGTLDKYTGDGLVAFWGAPLSCPDQADRAVSAALEIMDSVAAFNRLRSQVGLAPVNVRIGVESGTALVGDLGTTFRSTYTAVGDCINFASRLEAAAQHLPKRLAIGPVANSRLQAHKTHSLGQIALRGTSTTIEIFTVV